MLHPALEKIMTELRQLAESVKATTGELRPSNIINSNNFGIVSIDRDELSGRASALADLIEAQGRDDVTGLPIGNDIFGAGADVRGVVASRR